MVRPQPVNDCLGDNSEQDVSFGKDRYRQAGFSTQHRRLMSQAKCQERQPLRHGLSR